MHTHPNTQNRNNRFIAQCHLEGTLPIPPLRAPLLSLPGDREHGDGAEEEEDDDGTGHHRAAAAAAAAAAKKKKKKKASKLNVIPFNEQAQRVLAEFLRVTEAGREEEEGGGSEEELRSLLAMLKTA